MTPHAIAARLIDWLIIQLDRIAQRLLPPLDPDRCWWSVNIREPDEHHGAVCHAVPGLASISPDDLDPDNDHIPGDGLGHDLTPNCPCFPSISQTDRFAGVVVSHNAWLKDEYR